MTAGRRPTLQSRRRGCGGLIRRPSRRFPRRLDATPRSRKPSSRFAPCSVAANLAPVRWASKPSSHRTTISNSRGNLHEVVGLAESRFDHPLNAAREKLRNGFFVDATGFGTKQNREGLFNAENPEQVPSGRAAASDSDQVAKANTARANGDAWAQVAALQPSWSSTWTEIGLGCSRTIRKITGAPTAGEIRVSEMTRSWQSTGRRPVANRLRSRPSSGFATMPSAERTQPR